MLQYFMCSVLNALLKYSFPIMNFKLENNLKRSLYIDMKFRFLIYFVFKDLNFGVPYDFSDCFKHSSTNFNKCKPHMQ